MSTCATPACARLAFNGHRFCCRRCHGGGSRHSHGCRQRNSPEVPRAGPDYLTCCLEIPAQLPQPLLVAVRDTEELMHARFFLLTIGIMYVDLPGECRHGFLQRLLVAFHPDRCSLSEAHAISRVLTQMLAGRGLDLVSLRLHRPSRIMVWLNELFINEWTSGRGFAICWHRNG